MYHNDIHRHTPSLPRSKRRHSQGYLSFWNDNISYALATRAGGDTILIYGAMDADTAAVAAEGIADQVRRLQEETP